MAHEDAASRASRLEAIDELLPALFQALDVRDVFGRISEISKQALSHDVVGLPTIRLSLAWEREGAAKHSRASGHPVRRGSSRPNPSRSRRR